MRCGAAPIGTLAWLRWRARRSVRAGPSSATASPTPSTGPIRSPRAVRSTVSIDLVRGVPLITVLFMATGMLPLFLPETWSPDKLVRALVGVALFSSAYMAEVVRAGLQSIQRGQYDAANALALSYWQSL